MVVYRARVDNAVFYLRVAEEPGQDLTTDAEILGRLRTLGVSVPAIVAAEAAPAELARSYMIVTEIPGRSLAQGVPTTRLTVPPGPQDGIPPLSIR